MIYIFVDANALLNIYAYSPDDVAQLEKLVSEVAAEHVKLLVTDQLRREVLRNREAKIAETIKSHYTNNQVGQFPRLMQHYEEFADLNAASETYKELRDKIRKKLELDIKERKLPADKVLFELLSPAQMTTTTDDLLSAARKRVERGDPPGKKGSMGDALNWEHVIKHCPPETDLYFVTNDGDFLSPIDKTRFSDFLMDEWKSANGGTIFFFRSLRELFKQVAPGIQLSAAVIEQLTLEDLNALVWHDLDETEEPPFEPIEINPIEQAVSDLENSASFRNTHSAIARMPKIELLQPEQVRRLFRAAVSNGQIFSIQTDEDVAEFFEDLFNKRSDLIDDEIAAEFKEKYSAAQ